MARRGIDIAAVELFLVGEGDGVDDEIDLAPQLGDFGKDGVERRCVGDVAMADDMGAEFLRQRLDALLEGFALIGQRDFRALVGAGLGNAIGDRPVVCDAHDKAALAGHKALSTRHRHHSQ